jgi:hypothetical protein
LRSHRLPATVVVSTLLIVVHLGASDNPPRSLLDENVRKAALIVRAEILDSKMAKGGLMLTKVRILKCYRGELHDGDVLEYLSFKEEHVTPREWQHTGIIVFLRAIPPKSGTTGWGLATDFSEFGYSARLEKQVTRLMRKSR